MAGTEAQLPRRTWKALALFQPMFLETEGGLWAGKTPPPWGDLLPPSVMVRGHLARGAKPFLAAQSQTSNSPGFMLS